MNGDGRAETQAYVARLGAASFAERETFFATEARRHGVALERPFRFQLAPPPAATGPHAAEIPRSLREVVVGAATAREIGWQ